MAEKNVRSRVIRALKKAHAFAVENVCLPGTPDVNFAGGWIELKWMADWPKRDSTTVRIPHYTTQQKVWALKRKRAGERPYLLLNVQKTNDWLLIDGVEAGTLIGKATRQELIDSALAHWTSAAEMERQLLPYLTSPNESN